MQISLNRQKPNYELSEYYKKLAIHEKYSLRLYSSDNLAVSELVHGQLRLFPHKKKILFVGAGSPLFPSLMEFVSSEGLELIQRSWHEMATEQEILIDKNLLLVLYCEDDLFSGEIFPAEVFVPKWNTMKLYTLGISHSAFRYSSALHEQPEGFRMRVLCLDAHLSLAILGTRTRKLPSLLMGVSDWNEQSREEELGFFREDPFSVTQEELESIESSLPGFEPYFSKSTQRVCDRIVGRIPGIDAYAIKEFLAESWSLSKDENWMITASLCEWGGLKSTQWLSLKDDCDWPKEECFALSAEYAKAFQASIQETTKYLKGLMGL